MSKICVMGTGAWGIALALTLNDNGHDVTMWSKFNNEVSQLKRQHYNPTLLPNIEIPQTINITNNIHCVDDSDAVLLCIPSFAIKDVCLALPNIKNKLIINAGKGLDSKTGLRFSQIIEATLGIEGIVVISGPSHAEEVAKKIPTSIVAASKIAENAKTVQDLLMSNYMRVYVNDDVIGVEIGGALKNIIALCAGICEGIGMGDNTTAALMTRGLAEMTRLGIALGGKAETFMGLAGIGDIIVTCCSIHSRNHRAGKLIGKGISPQEAIKQVGTVEGAYALKTAFDLSQNLNVDMPIVKECYRIFNEGISPNEAIENLMNRPKKSESI